MKHKFRFNVIQEVEVELDDEVVNEEYLNEFSTYMWNVDDIKDIAEYLARQKALYDGYSVEFAPNEYEAKVIDEYVEEA